MQKLLIADSSEAWVCALREALEPRFQVRTCCDGRKLEAVLPQWQPDILILSLSLPYVDGLTVLRRTTFRPSVILAIAMHRSRYLEQSVMDLGIDYTLIMPSLVTALLQLDELLASYTLPADISDPESAAIHHLQLLRIPPHLDGYRQLCTALPMFLQNPHQQLTKELYPAVAVACGCPDGRAVEYSIRKAIQAAWKKKDNAIWRKYFPLDRDGHIPCPSNKAFLCQLTAAIRDSLPQV